MGFCSFQSYQIKVFFYERDILLEVTGCIRIHGRESEFLVRYQDFYGRIYHWKMQSDNGGGDRGSAFGFIQNVPLLYIFYDPSSRHATCRRKRQFLEKICSYFNFRVRDFRILVRQTLRLNRSEQETSQRCSPWKTTRRTSFNLATIKVAGLLPSECLSQLAFYLLEKELSSFSRGKGSNP